MLPAPAHGARAWLSVAAREGSSGWPLSVLSRGQAAKLSVYPILTTVGAYQTWRSGKSALQPRFGPSLVLPRMVKALFSWRAGLVVGNREHRALHACQQSAASPFTLQSATFRHEFGGHDPFDRGWARIRRSGALRPRDQLPRAGVVRGDHRIRAGQPLAVGQIRGEFCTGPPRGRACVSLRLMVTPSRRSRMYSRRYPNRRRWPASSRSRGRRS
jgi:hypothetical protein